MARMDGNFAPARPQAGKLLPGAVKHRRRRIEDTPPDPVATSPRRRCALASGGKSRYSQLTPVTSFACTGAFIHNPFRPFFCTPVRASWNR